MAFITDYGKEMVVTDQQGNITHRIPRYAAWIHDEGKGKHQVTEVGNDLGLLQSVYAVDDNHVFRVIGE